MPAARRPPSSRGTGPKHGDWQPLTEMPPFPQRGARTCSSHFLETFPAAERSFQVSACARPRTGSGPTGTARCSSPPRPGACWWASCRSWSLRVTSGPVQGLWREAVTTPRSHVAGRALGGATACTPRPRSGAAHGRWLTCVWTSRDHDVGGGLVPGVDLLHKKVGGGWLLREPGNRAKQPCPAACHALDSKTAVAWCGAHTPFPTRTRAGTGQGQRASHGPARSVTIKDTPSQSPVPRTP